VVHALRAGGVVVAGSGAWITGKSIDLDHVSLMKTTTIRELKHATSTVLSWVAEGQSVEVRRRRKPVAMLVPLKRRLLVARPDFLARLQAIYGPVRLPSTATELVAEARGER
jgi:antitoxin (DNA-binding transcriptional repressor) of toxin-antitoxin stability system